MRATGAFEPVKALFFDNSNVSLVKKGVYVRIMCVFLNNQEYCGDTCKSRFFAIHCDCLCRDANMFFGLNDFSVL